MSHSSIAEVRDQLSLDFADGEYLSALSRNLGMDRPIIGFSDDVWRALVKQLALEYKQVNTQFYRMLEIVFGVQITKAGSLSSSVIPGDNKCILNDTSQFPQVGTMVFDEGLVTEETHKYGFIDRHTNTVYLDGSKFAFNHTAYPSDAESPILCSNDTSFVVANASSFSETNFPYTVVLGRGTDYEEINSVVSVDTATGVLVLGSTPENSHDYVVPSDIADDLAQDIFLPTSFVEVDDTTKFPSNGIVRLNPTNIFTVVGNVTPNTNRVISVAANSFVENSLVGFEVVMRTSPNTAGRRRRIIANGTDSITLDRDWSSLGSAPQNGNTFSIFPIVDYTSNDSTSGILNLRENLDLDTSVTSWNIPNNSVIELMETKSTVAFAPVKSTGQGWDIIQSTTGKVEIYLPEALISKNDPRSASYLHAPHDSTAPSTTLSANITAEDEILPIVNEPDFPVVGVVEVNSAERIAYARPVSFQTSTAALGATSLVLKDTSKFGSTGTIVLSPGSSYEEVVNFSANNISTGTLTVSPLSMFHKENTVVVCRTLLLLSRPITNPATSGDPVSLYDPPHVGTDVIIGDHNIQEDTWEGPYVHSFFEPTPVGATTSPTNLGEIIPGRLQLAMSAGVGSTAVEVEDALHLLNFTNSNVKVGSGRASRQVVDVQEISLRNRVGTTLAADANIGDTEIEVASFGPGGPNGVRFPNAHGYRIVINEMNEPVFQAVSDWFSSLVSSGAELINWYDGAEETNPTTESASFVVTIAYVDADSVDRSATLAGVTPGQWIRMTLASGEWVQGRVVSSVDDSPSWEYTCGLLQMSDGFAWPPSFPRTTVSVGGTLQSKEVGYVTGTLIGPNRFKLESPLVHAHSSGSSVSLLKDVIRFGTPLSKFHVGKAAFEDRSTAVETAPGRAYYPVEDQNFEIVCPCLQAVSLASAAGLDISGGAVTINFGSEKLPVKSTLTANENKGNTAITVVDGSVFPASGPFVVTVGSGRRFAERVLVTSIVGNVLTLGSGTYGLGFDHSEGDIVLFEPGSPETVEYDEINTNDLSFDIPVVLNYNHYPAESVIDTIINSEPKSTGFDYPFRIPDDILTRLIYLLNAIRAAGIQVTLIYKR